MPTDDYMMDSNKSDMPFRNGFGGTAPEGGPSVAETLGTQAAAAAARNRDYPSRTPSSASAHKLQAQAAAGGAEEQDATAGAENAAERRAVEQAADVSPEPAPLVPEPSSIPAWAYVIARNSR